MIKDDVVKIHNLLEDNRDTAYTFKEISELTEVDYTRTEFILTTILKKENTKLTPFFKERLVKEIAHEFRVVRKYRNIGTAWLERMKDDELIEKYIKVCINKS